MKKLTIILITTFLIISGCVDKADKTNSGDKSIIENTKIEDRHNGDDDGNIMTANTEIVDNNIVNNNIDDHITIDTGSEWCKLGDKIIVKTTKGQEEFTIKGITTYQGKEVCRAEEIYDNGKKIRYFSKDGKFVSEIATSSSGSGNASAYSEASINMSE